MVSLGYHGDQAVTPGMLDFAVNVRHAQPPDWLVRRLAARLPDLACYPSIDDVHRAQDAVAERHGRARHEVLPLAGAAEGFALLPNLRPERAAVIAPSFTEPAVALTAAGVPVHHVVLEPPFGLDGVVVPEDADLVVVGNPTNPTSVLHTREQLLALRRPGRILVIDEAFADSVPGEPESLAGESLPDVLVLRSLTKTWSLAGLRVGYALGSPDVLARLTAQRAHWPVGTLQLTAIAACCAPRGGCRRGCRCGCGWRSCAREMAAGLRVGGRQRGRRARAVRVVQHAGCRFDTEELAEQGNCYPPVRYVRRVWTSGICGRRCARSGRCWRRRSSKTGLRTGGDAVECAASRRHRGAGRGLPAAACPVVGLGRPGVR